MQRRNDDCRIAWCEDDDYAHGFLMSPKSLQKTGNDQPDSVGSTGGGLKILLPEYKNQEYDRGVTEVCERAVGGSQCETKVQEVDHQRTQRQQEVNVEQVRQEQEAESADVESHGDECAYQNDVGGSEFDTDS